MKETASANAKKIREMLVTESSYTRELTRFLMNRDKVDATKFLEKLGYQEEKGSH